MSSVKAAIHVCLLSTILAINAMRSDNVGCLLMISSCNCLNP